MYRNPVRKGKNMADKYNVVIEVVDTKEYISIELPQDEDSLQEQLKEYGINENTKVRLPFLNGKIENDEDMLIETDLWYVTDKIFSGMEGLNVLLSKSEELKNERVESYAMEHRDDINSPENLLNLLVQKEDIPYHEYTSDPDAGITRGTSVNGKFGRTYLYENYKEMWRDINTIPCRTEKMIDYMSLETIGGAIAAAKGITVCENGYLEAEKLNLQKYSLTEIKEQFMERENKIEPKRPVQAHHQKMKSPKL